jgi:Sugar-transfer associated ATP-grasp
MSFMLSRIIRFLNEEIVIYLDKADKKPLGQQIKELRALKKYYGYIPYQYAKHCLYLKSFDGDIFDYIPPEIVARYRDSMNPRDACGTVINKKKFSQVMIQNNLPGITHLFTVHRSGSIRDGNEKEVTFSQFRKNLTASEKPHFFLKPVNGGSGNGIQKMTVRERCLEINTKEIVNEAAFHDTLFSRSRYLEFIVQPEIIQHELLNRINPSSVNTIRIDTFIRGNDVINNAAFLRMSNGSTYTDNWAKGGLIVKIDLDTGVLDDFGKTKAKYGRRHIQKHPLTGFRFAGTPIPFWSDVKEVVRHAALALRPLQFLGWDVAIGPDGPILVEANHDFDIFSLQETSKGLRRTPVGATLLQTLCPNGAVMSRWPNVTQFQYRK